MSKLSCKISILISSNNLIFVKLPVHPPSLLFSTTNKVFLSIASMVFGAVAAIGQKNLKRLVAYSSIGHIGYALAGISIGTNEGIQSSITYMVIYLIMNLGLFSCLSVSYTHLTQPTILLV